MSRPPEHPAKAPVTHVTSKAPALALKPSDFAAPRSPRATADLRDRIDAWARVVVSRLGAAGARVDATAIVAVESDGLRVDFVAGSNGAGVHGAVGERQAGSRGVNAAAGSNRAPPACLTFRVDVAGVRAGLELPAGHARSARVVLGDPARALEASSALQELPEQFVMGLSGESAGVAAQGGTAADLRELLDGIERGADTPAPAGLWIGWRVPRDLAIEHADLLDEQLQDALAALAQLFAILAVLPADRVAEGEGRARRPGDKASKSAHKSSRGRGDDDRDRSTTTKRGRAIGARERAGSLEPSRDQARPARRDRDPEPPPQGRAEPAPPAVPATRRRGLAELKTPPRPGLRPRPSPADASATIDRGTRVEVLRGPFSGKVGVVQELDGKGGARVMLGLLAVRVDVAQLAASPVGHTRPVLSSSHRKPLSARS